MTEKWIGAIVLMTASVGLGLVAIVSAIQSFRRGEFHHRSTWFLRSEDKKFFRVLISLMALAGVALILIGLFFGFRILLRPSH